MAPKKKIPKKTTARKKSKTAAQPASKRKKKKRRRKPGRPRINIDASQVVALASMHCTMEEIAAFVGCSVDTLERRFADAIKSGRDQGRASLRRYQWKKARAGNPALLIWLGKQLLGQKDQVESTITERIREVRFRVVDPRDDPEAPPPPVQTKARPKRKK